MPQQVVVVGAGIAGLVAAHELRAIGLEPIVLEASPRAGGKIRTERVDGWQLDWGPQTVLLPDGESALRRALDRAGLNDALVRPQAGGKARFVLGGGRLRRVPRDLIGLLGVGGLLRTFGEPFVTARREGPAETVREFAIRRFGRKAADVLFDAFVTGIWAGDPGRLELCSAFPRLHAAEAGGQSVFSLLRQGGARRRVYGLSGGLGRLPQALAERLGPALHLETPALRLERVDRAWRVHTPRQVFRADAVVVTTPAPRASELLSPLDGELGRLIAQIPYASAAVVNLGYRIGDFRRGPPRGFGFLVPHREGLVSLGCLFPGAVFPDVAPPGHVLLRVIVGGRRCPDAVDLPSDDLVAQVRGEIEPLLGLDAVPKLTRVFKIPEAIPQYERGHASRLEAIEAGLLGQRGLFLTGNPYRGISVPDVATRAEETAQAVGHYLEPLRPGSPPQIQVKETIRVCPLCRLPLSSTVSGRIHLCAGCGTRYHRSCSRELGGCGTVGCDLFRGGAPDEAGGALRGGAQADS